MQIRFEWDDDNAAKHFKKHGVSFEVAARVFADTEVIGIISARKADPKERKRYEQEDR